MQRTDVGAGAAVAGGGAHGAGGAIRSAEAWADAFDARIGALESRLVTVRRHLHANPEPSGEEVETTRFLAGLLTEAGWQPVVAQQGVGLTVDVTIGQPAPDSPLIALRADIDALRMPDEKATEYRSCRPGLAHACGHDVHSTILIGAALGLRGLVDGGAIDGGATRPGDGVRLRLLFQSAEETSDGARWLVEQGALDGVSAILGLHVDPERAVGTVGVRYGVLTAHCDDVEIAVIGHGGHAARPHHTLDPIAAAAQLVSALYQFLPRAVDSRNASVFTIGRIGGGHAPNVIPERVDLEGTLRTTDAVSRGVLMRRIDSICAGVAESSGAEIRVRLHSSLAGVENDARAAWALETAARRILGPQGVTLIDKPSMGGEDFSVYLERVPGAMLRLGCAVPGVAHAPFLHSPLFDVDERTIGIGARVLTRAALLLAAGEGMNRNE